MGCAHIHTPDFVRRLQRRTDHEVARVWDHDPARAAATASAFGAARVSDLDEVWQDDTVAAVVVCAETDRHRELVLAAAGAGKHLFVEKPLSTRADDARELAEAVEAAGVLFQTGYFMRGYPAHRFLKDHLARGSFGKVTRARHANLHAGALEGWFDGPWRWLADPAQAGFGGFGDLGSHSLDLLVWFFGEVSEATAVIGSATGRYGDLDEFGEGMVRFRSGLVATLAAGWVDVANPVTLEICGTEGHAHICHGKLYFRSEHVAGADGASPWEELPDNLPHAFELFLDALGGGDVPLVSVRDAAYSAAVMEALYRAAATRTWLPL